MDIECSGVCDISIERQSSIYSDWPGALVNKGSDWVNREGISVGSSSWRCHNEPRIRLKYCVGPCAAKCVSVSSALQRRIFVRKGSPGFHDWLTREQNTRKHVWNSTVLKKVAASRISTEIRTAPPAWIDDSQLENITIVNKTVYVYSHDHVVVTLVLIWRQVTKRWYELLYVHDGFQGSSVALHCVSKGWSRW